MTSCSRTVPSYCLGPAGFLGRLAVFGTGRLVGLGLSLGLTAGSAGGAAEDRLSAPVDDFPLLGLITPLIFDNIDGLRSSTSGSSASVGCTAVAAGGGRLDPLSVDFLASFRGETDRIARLCTFWVGIFLPALDLGSVASRGGSSAGSAGSAGGLGLGASSTGLLASFLGETDLMDRRCSCLIIIFPPPSRRSLLWNQ